MINSFRPRLKINRALDHGQIYFIMLWTTVLKDRVLDRGARFCYQYYYHLITLSRKQYIPYKIVYFSNTFIFFNYTKIFIFRTNKIYYFSITKF
jgi:hypothetical protein